MDHKIQELKEHIKDCAKYYYADYNEMVESYLKDNLWDDIHQSAFNTDFYIVGTYKAKEWLGDKAMEIVAYIQNYQKNNFGEDQIETFLNADGSINYERIVNIYTFCRGFDLVSDFIEEWENDFNNFDAWLEKETHQAKESLQGLIRLYKYTRRVRKSPPCGW